MSIFGISHATGTPRSTITLHSSPWYRRTVRTCFLPPGKEHIQHAKDNQNAGKELGLAFTLR